MRCQFRSELLLEGSDDSASHHERWVVSYADFITLMFAFFVVMYSISSVNDGKFRVLSQALSHVFDDAELAAAVEAERIESESKQPIDLFEVAGEDPLARLLSSPALNPRQLEQRLAAHLSGAVSGGLITIRSSQDWTEIELSTDFAFADSESTVAEAAQTVLNQVAALVQPLNTPVRVEGFSDNVPPSPAATRSNRARSAVHSAAIADLLIAAGIDHQRLSTTAFGELHPLDSNASAAGRARNRRVVIAVGKHTQLDNPGVSLATRGNRPEKLPERTFSRVSQMPGPAQIQF